MVKRGKESMKSFGSHLNSEKDERLKWTKIEVDNNVKRILKHVNRINKDATLKKKSELIQLVEDFHTQYQSIYALYDNLKDELSKKNRSEAEDNDFYVSEPESYHSLDEAGTSANESKTRSQKVTNNSKHGVVMSDSEDSTLKDILTSTSKAKGSPTLESVPSLSSTDDSVEIVEYVNIETKQTDFKEQNLIHQCAWLKEKLSERDEELLSFTKKYQILQDDASAQADQIACTKVEMQILSTQMKELDDQIKLKLAETLNLHEENSRLHAQILEVESIAKRKEDEFSDLQQKYEDNEKQLRFIVEESSASSSKMHSEVNSLHLPNDELEEEVSSKTNEGSDRLKDLRNQVDVLQQELESMSKQKADSDLLLEKKTREISECHIQIDNLKENLASKTTEKQEMVHDIEGLQVHLKDLESEVNYLFSQKNDLEEQIIHINHEVEQSRKEKEDLHSRIIELNRTIKERTENLSVLQEKMKNKDEDISDQIGTLTAHIKSVKKELGSVQAEKNKLRMQIEKDKQDYLQSLSQKEKEKQEYLQSLSQKEKENMNLKNKITDVEKNLNGKQETVNKLYEEQNNVKSKFSGSKKKLQTAERKMEEMAEEFYKKCEDNLRIISRRIQVAEQLHLEYKEWYRKTKDKYEQEHMDLKEKMAAHEVALRKIKNMSLAANDMLTSLDAMALKFDECSANFPNRISKVSCELKFAKDWVMRKNKSMKHIKEDSDCLVGQLDNKEAEILQSREKVWKLENKVRELEKMVKEKEDGMLSFQEEKREAIRQLCVWIDHHRSRSDYYKKMLSEMTFNFA